MSLKTVHIVFITSAIVLSVGFGWWSMSRSLNTWLGTASFVLGAALAGYLLWFLKKIKKLNGAS